MVSELQDERPPHWTSHRIPVGQLKVPPWQLLSPLQAMMHRSATHPPEQAPGHDEGGALLPCGQHPPASQTVPWPQTVPQVPQLVLSLPVLAQ